MIFIYGGTTISAQTYLYPLYGDPEKSTPSNFVKLPDNFQHHVEVGLRYLVFVFAQGIC